MKNSFWKTVLESFSIFRYKELTKRNTGESFRFFILFFTLLAFISLLLSIGNFIAFPDMIKDEISKVEEFTINVDFNTTEDLNFPSNKPLISIVDYENESDAKITVTDEEIIYRPMIGVRKNFSLGDYGDIKENSEEVGKLAGALFVLLLPSLIIYAYLYHVIKYLLIAVLYSLIAKIVVTLIGKKIRYKKLFSAGLFSLTPLILIEMILLPFHLQLYYIPFILYTIWYIIVTVELIEEF